MDISIIATVIGSSIAIIGFNYQFLRNFKLDIQRDIDKHEQQIESFEAKTQKLDERMFQVLTGKKLEDAILEEKTKKS